MMSETFSQLVGNIFKSFGAIEYRTNRLIESLTKDDEILPKEEILKLSFERRIKILSRLLRKRTQMPADEIDSLVENLKDLAKKRNVIAHNPVATNAQGNSFIIHIREASDPEGKVFYGEEDLLDLLGRARQAAKTITELMMKKLPSLMPKVSTNKSKT